MQISSEKNAPNWLHVPEVGILDAMQRMLLPEEQYSSPGELQRLYIYFDSRALDLARRDGGEKVHADAMIHDIMLKGGATYESIMEVSGRSLITVKRAVRDGILEKVDGKRRPARVNWKQLFKWLYGKPSVRSRKEQLIHILWYLVNMNGPTPNVMPKSSPEYQSRIPNSFTAVLSELSLAEIRLVIGYLLVFEKKRRSRLPYTGVAYGRLLEEFRKIKGGIKHSEVLFPKFYVCVKCKRFLAPKSRHRQDAGGMDFGRGDENIADSREKGKILELFRQCHPETYEAFMNGQALSDADSVMLEEFRERHLKEYDRYPALRTEPFDIITASPVGGSSDDRSSYEQDERILEMYCSECAKWFELTARDEQERIEEAVELFKLLKKEDPKAITTSVDDFRRIIRYNARRTRRSETYSQTEIGRSAGYKDCQERIVGSHRVIVKKHQTAVHQTLKRTDVGRMHSVAENIIKLRSALSPGRGLAQFLYPMTVEHITNAVLQETDRVREQLQVLKDTIVSSANTIAIFTETTAYTRLIERFCAKHGKELCRIDLRSQGSDSIQAIMQGFISLENTKQLSVLEFPGVFLLAENGAGEPDSPGPNMPS